METGKIHVDTSIGKSAGIVLACKSLLIWTDRNGAYDSKILKEYGVTCWRISF